MTKNPKCTKVRLNLLQQEVYTFNPEMLTDRQLFNEDKKTPKKYFELVEQTQKDGSIIEKLVECDYPITSDYVKSFESSANPKNDIVSAMSQPHKQGLGDITALQELLSMDTSKIRENLEHIEKVKAEYLKAKSQPKVEKEEKVGEN